MRAGKLCVLANAEFPALRTVLSTYAQYVCRITQLSLTIVLVLEIRSHILYFHTPPQCLAWCDIYCRHLMNACCVGLRKKRNAYLTFRWAKGRVRAYLYTGHDGCAKLGAWLWVEKVRTGQRTRQQVSTVARPALLLAPSFHSHRRAAHDVRGVRRRMPEGPVENVCDGEIGVRCYPPGCCPDSSFSIIHLTKYILSTC